MHNLNAYWISVSESDSGSPGSLVKAGMDPVIALKRIEEALRRNEQKFTEAQRMAHVGYWDCDLNAERSVWTEETYRIFGLPPQDQGITWDQLASLIHPDDREEAIRTIKEAQQGGPRCDIEFRVVRPDGEGRVVYSHVDVIKDASGRPIRMCGIIQDITERKQTDEKLRNSEARYRALYQDNPAMLFTLDEQGVVLTVNPSGVNQLGYSLDELVGQPVLNVFHPDDREDVARQLQTCLHGPDRVHHWQYRKIRKDGAVLWVHELARPIRDLSGAVNVLVVCEDITERKRADEDIRTLNATLEQRVRDRTRELAESENRFHTIYDTAPVSIWQEDWTEVIAFLDVLRAQGVTDFECYFREHPECVEPALKSVRVVDVNHWTLAMFGAETKEQLTASLATIFATPDTLPGFVGELVALAQGQLTYRTEMTLNTVKGDAIRCFLSMTFPPQGSDGGNVLVSVIDITERKRAAEALRRSEENARLLFDTTLQGVVFQDTEGRTLSMNASAIRILGKTPEEMSPGGPSLDTSRTMLREDGSPFPLAERPAMVAISTGREVGSVIMGVYNPREHAYRWVDLRAIPLFRPGTKIPHQVYCIFDDITERRRNERRIRRQTDLLTGINRIFRETLPHVTDDEVVAIFLKVVCGLTASSIGFVEGLQGPGAGTRITLERSLQVSGGLGRVEALALLRSSELRVLRTASSAGGQIINRTGAGEDRPDVPAINRCLSSPLLENGKAIGLIGLANKPSGYTEDDLRAVEAIAPAFLEVLKRKRSEQSVLDLNDQLAERALALERANKELESFSYSVSHDLRAPLRSLVGFSRALEEDCGYRLDEAGRGHLLRIRKASDRMGELIDDMLNLAQVSRGELRRTSVDLSALARRVAEGLRMTEPKRNVEFVIEPDLIASGDAHLLLILMENLLGNAWKFSGHQPVARIEFGRTLRDGQPAFFVRDNGVGFDMHYAYKLFGAFQRLHTAAEFPGTGIGLATVQRVIHRHGGGVAAESEPDHGATFYFTLPDEAPSPAPNPAHSP